MWLAIGRSLASIWQATEKFMAKDIRITDPHVRGIIDRYKSERGYATSTKAAAQIILEFDAQKRAEEKLNIRDESPKRETAGAT